MTPAEIARRLHGRQCGFGWIAKCPAHSDNHPSLSIGDGGDGKTLLHCHAGCTVETICAAAGIEVRDLFGDSGENGNGADRERIVAVYPYTDETGAVLFEVVRYEPKGFRQRRPDGRGGWIWNLAGVRRLLYNLPAVLAAELVLVVEGEKDVETGKRLGLVATTNAGGAKAEWTDSYCDGLRGKSVVVICDADPVGLEHGWKVARSVYGIAASVRLLEKLPGGPKDLTEWYEQGGTREQLLDIVKSTPEMRSAEAAKSHLNAVAGFVLTPLADLLAEPDVPVEYVWGDRLAAGTVSGLVGKPKVGKGTLARNLCLAIARGEDFLGLPTLQGECIYLALEERAEDIRNDFAAMGATGSEPVFIHAAAAPAAGISALCEMVRERKPRLVVIDPLFRLARIRDEKAYAETYAALGPLIDAARETGAHLMLVHHGGKGHKTDPIDSPLGSTAIGAAVSTLIVVKRTEAYRTVQTVQRIGQDMSETVLEFDPETRRLSIGGTRYEVEREEYEDRILEFLQNASEPQTQDQIRDGVDGKTRTIRAALTALAGAKKVKRTGKGTRGDAFLYECWFSGSNDTVGTKEPESLIQGESHENTGEILVPTFEQEKILVPGHGPSAETKAPVCAAPPEAFVEVDL